MIELRPYQVEAVERILERRSLLLAMVMGSGKTITSVAAVRRLRQRREVDHGAVFALKSTKYQWQREINRADPRAKVQVIEGDKRRRTAGYRRASKFHYTVLHYDCLIHDWDLIREYLPIDFLIMDEISALKSPKAKRTRRARLLGEHCDIRLGLSGKPVENRPEELYSIMKFIDPDVLGPFTKFDRTFVVRDGWGRPQRYRNLHLIQARLGPAMFRRTRDDIKEWLPKRVEVEMPVILDAQAMSLHDLVKQDLAHAIDSAIAGGMGGGFSLEAHYGAAPSDGQDMSAMGQVMSRMLAMRMLSSHPYLLLHSAVEFDDPDTKKGSEYASYLKGEGFLDGLTLDNAKLDALIETIEEILDADPNHKVAVFSYFKPMLRIIAARLTKGKIGYTTLTGDITSTLERDHRIQRFNTDSTCKIFLSSDAGAYGVDLMAGSHLICYDLPWSGGALAQRVARIDRTSSTWPQIQIIYMYGHGTIEERMYAQLQQKAKVADAFVDGQFSADGTLRLDLQTLREFLES